MIIRKIIKNNSNISDLHQLIKILINKINNNCNKKYIKFDYHNIYELITYLLSIMSINF